MLPLTALKLVLVPSFIGLVSLAGKRWGARFAGWLAGMPIVAGPILFLLWIERGAGFARAAAVYSLAAVASVIAYSTGYAWLSRRWAWPVALAGAYVVWFLTALVILAASIGTIGAGLVAVGSLLAAPHALPKPVSIPPQAQLPRVDLALRMLTGAALTLIVTMLAGSLGTRLSGVFALFPIMSAVLAVFTHRNAGSDAVIAMLRGLASGLYSLVAFCLTLALMPSDQPAWVFAAAVAAALAAQAFVGVVHSQVDHVQVR